MLGTENSALQILKEGANMKDLLIEAMDRIEAVHDLTIKEYKMHGTSESYWQTLNKLYGMVEILSILTGEKYVIKEEGVFTAEEWKERQVEE